MSQFQQGEMHLESQKSLKLLKDLELMLCFELLFVMLCYKASGMTRASLKFTLQ